METQNEKQCDIRLICDKNQAERLEARLIDAMKSVNYKLLKCSYPRPSRKNDSDVLVYLEFLEEN